MDRVGMLKMRFGTEPLANFLGIHVENLEKGRAILCATIRPEFLIAGKGIVQGGLIDVVADFAGVYAAMSLIPDSEEEFHTPADTLLTQFYRPISMADQTMRAVALVSEETRGHITVDIDIYCVATGDVCSKKKASTRIRFTKPARTKKVTSCSLQ